VPSKFSHLASIGQIPNADGRLVTAFARHQVLAIGRKSHCRQRFTRRIDNVCLAILAWVEQHHGASVQQQQQKKRN
jgi:hypothetical protein